MVERLEDFLNRKDAAKRIEKKDLASPSRSLRLRGSYGLEGGTPFFA
jgi:hypothetical protein